MNEKLKLLLKGFGILALYFGIMLFQTIPFDLMGINLKEIPTVIVEIYNILCELMIIVIIFIMFEKEMKIAWNDLKKNHLKYFSKYLKYYIIALIVMFSGNFIIFMMNGGNIAGNEQSVRDMFALSPIYTFISAVMLAPVLEELTFRLGLRSIFGNNWIFIIMSGLIFGGIHLVSSYQTPMDLLYIIPYGSFGIAFAYMLVKTNNIFVSMGFHLMHNGLLLSMQFLVAIFG